MRGLSDELMAYGKLKKTKAFPQYLWGHVWHTNVNKLALRNAGLKPDCNRVTNLLHIKS